MNKFVAIIDLDTPVYRAAGAAQKRNPETGEIEHLDQDGTIAKSNAKKYIISILEKTKCSDYIGYLTQKNDITCFRTNAFPEYKANRQRDKRPRDYDIVREYFVKTWFAEVVDSIEADDACCIAQYEKYDNNFQQLRLDSLKNGVFDVPALIVHIDKDIDQVPGLHFNPDKDAWYYITPLEGLKNFYKQVLSGDRSDNIPRVKKRWKEKEAFDKIHNATSENQIKDIVLAEWLKVRYNSDNLMKDQSIKDIEFQGNLLHLKRHINDSYKF